MRTPVLIIFVSILLIGVSGCLKDKGFDSHEYGIKSPDESAVGIGFPESQNKINVTAIENENTAQTIQVALVNLLSDVPATQDLHVRLTLNPSLIDAYNANNNPDVLPLPEDAHTIPSMVVVIKKGERTGKLTITIPDAKNELDITKTYALGFTISGIDESGNTIAENLKNILVGVAIKNKWDGVYEIVGYAIRGGDPSLTGPFGPVEREFVTGGATTVKWAGTHPWGRPGSILAAGYEPIFTVDETTNKVTVTSSNGLVRNDDSYDSRYDPATKTFYAQWTYGAGPTGPSARRFTDTAVYVKPR